MTYLNSFQKEKVERCLRKMNSWHKLLMTSEEQLMAAERMKHNLTIAQAM